MAGLGAFACEDFTVQGPGGAQLNPGWNSGNFTLNSYPIPIAVYSASGWNGTANPPSITGGPVGSNPFSLSFFGQDTSGGPLNGSYYWSYSCTLPQVTEVAIYFTGVQNVLGNYTDQYKIFVAVPNNVGGVTRSITGLMALGDGSLYCTVFPFAISQGTTTDSCTQCR